MRRKAISRRALCAASILAEACKRAADPYFGWVTTPNRQRLCYALGGEPESLDPAYYFGGFESFVIPALFEGLTSYHPATLQPMAALATHFEAAPGRSEVTFYLRGHPQARGEALPNTDNLQRQYQGGKLAQDFSRGRRAPPSSIPALWSDGRPVTSHDFVYSWRRMVDPVTAAPYASMLNAVSNAEAIQKGKLPPDSLGVKALDDFTLQIDLRPPVSNFLQLLAAPVMAAVPRWTIEAARQRGRESSWSDPDQIVTSGAFTLKQRRPFDKIVVVKNPRYYEARLVALDEIEFPTVTDGVTTANLYRAGEVDAMTGAMLSALLQPILEDRRDFHVAPACFVIWHGFNIHKPPFDNVLLRYALNMAADKAAIAGVFGGGRKAARNLVPPIEGYDAPISLPVPIDGATYDILAYNPEGARALLSKAGYPHGTGPDGRAFRFEMLIPSLPHSRPIAEMLQSQWRSNLNVESKLVVQEFSVWAQNVLGLRYSGAAEGGGWPDYLDPKGLFDWFADGSTLNGTGYDDATFNAMLAASDLAADPAARMQKLADCERYLLKSMPVIPIFHNVWLYLQKPFVRGLEGNALDKHPFKYAWIDTNWRPR